MLSESCAERQDSVNYSLLTSHATLAYSTFPTTDYNDLLDSRYSTLLRQTALHPRHSRWSVVAR